MIMSLQASFLTLTPRYSFVFDYILRGPEIDRLYFFAGKNEQSCMMSVMSFANQLTLAPS